MWYTDTLSIESTSLAGLSLAGLSLEGFTACCAGITDPSTNEKR